MNTHHSTPPQRPRYNMGYRTCPECDFQFTPERPGQTTCNLCRTASHFPHRKKHCQSCHTPFTPRTSTHLYCNACGKERERERNARNHAAARAGQRICIICSRPFWARTPPAKICHKDECKAEGKRRAEQRQPSPKRRKERGNE